MRLAPLASLVLLVAVAVPANAAFDASFAPKPGNSWWVEVAVTANEPLAGVDARVNGGTWIALEKKSWGTWAKSFHVPDGSHVEFRARSQGGATDQSGAYVWPSAAPAGGSAFTATFAPKPGNQWWVETDVTANNALAGVDARVGGGNWVALEKKSWGSWAKSFHVPDGSTVTFRARATSGEVVESGGYRWPSAEPLPGGGTTPPPTDVAFGPKAGNEWWVETFAIANASIQRVEGRAEGGPWNAMTLRDWGAWAASFHVPPGKHVQFRATTSQGTDTSGLFVWPQAQPVGGGSSWPQEGAYARFATQANDPEPSNTRGHWTIIHHDGAWWSLREAVRESAGGTSKQVHFCMGHQFPHGPTTTTPGATVNVEVEACTDHAYQVRVEGLGTTAAHQEGRAVTFATWSGSRVEESCQCIEWRAKWDTNTGLVAQASQAGLHSGNRYDLVDTDAPLARV